MPTVIESPPSRALVAVKPTVHVERAEPVCGEPLNETAVGADVAVSVTAVAFAATASALVLTVSVERPADEFVTPSIVSDAAVLGGSTQVPPLFASVTVATAPAPVAAAEQFEKPAPRVMVGVGGTEKPEENVVVIVSPALSAPVELVEKFTVHAVRASATREVALTVTALGEVCATIVTPAALAAVVSALVLTVSTDAPVVLVFVTL